MLNLEMADLAALQKNLGITFNKLSLLEQALVHSSYINENPGLASASNERLEFLGDAVLGLIVAEKLYREFPDLNEGEMTRLRAILVQRDTLARVAKNFGLGEHLFLGKGEEAGGGRNKPANLAAVLEAVVAAFFLDKDLNDSREFVLNLFSTEFENLRSPSTGTDYKSKLQELIQAREQKTPTYHLIEATGPDHDKTFTVEARLGNTVLGKGTGKSKKTAESEAAHSALEKLANVFTQ